VQVSKIKERTFLAIFPTRVFPDLVQITSSFVLQRNPNSPQSELTHTSNAVFELFRSPKMSQQGNKTGKERHVTCVFSKLMALSGCLHVEINHVMIYSPLQNQQ